MEAAEAKKKEEEAAECKKKKEEEEDKVKAEVEAAEVKKKEEEVAECKTEEQDKKMYIQLCKEKPVEKQQVKLDRELYIAISKNDTEGKSRKAVSFSETVSYITQNVAEENLDDTLEVDDTSKDIEQKFQVNFNPPSLEQIEKHVEETIAEIRKIGTASEKDDRENEDSDSLVIDDQMECTPPCSQMPCNYGKTR